LIADLSVIRECRKSTCPGLPAGTVYNEGTALLFREVLAS